MRTKIAIVHGRMVFGGAERVLINMLRILDYTKYDVDLYLLEPLKDNEDGFQDRIDKRVHIKFVNEIIVSCKTPYYANRLYDCAIAFQGIDLSILEILNYHLLSKCRIAWIHGDCSCYNYSYSIKNSFIKEYHLIDKIFCVSKKVEAIFRDFYPMLQNRTEVFYNVINKEEIITHSNDYIALLKNNNSILSVGRIAPEKGHILIPQVAKRLKEDGFCFKWDIIGDGPSRAEVDNEINKYNVQDVVHILGYKSNPYPYIKTCNLFVLPSFAEGYGMVAAEALILQRPIVITPECGIAEQIQNRVTGLIAQDSTSDGLYGCIKDFLSHDSLRKTIEYNVKGVKWDNQLEINKLYSFIDDCISRRSIWKNNLIIVLLFFYIKKIINKFRCFFI